MPTKGPLDRLTELELKSRSLARDIVKGRSGDGVTGPDLRAQKRVVDAERDNLARSNPRFPLMRRGMPPAKGKK